MRLENKALYSVQCTPAGEHDVRKRGIEPLKSTENLKKQVIRKNSEHLSRFLHLQYISKAIYQKGSPYNWTGKRNTFMKYWGKVRISQDLGKTDRFTEPHEKIQYSTEYSAFKSKFRTIEVK
jgi:hypothetical protein